MYNSNTKTRSNQKISNLKFAYNVKTYNLIIEHILNPKHFRHPFAQIFIYDPLYIQFWYRNVFKLRSVQYTKQSKFKNLIFGMHQNFSFKMFQ